MASYFTLTLDTTAPANVTVSINGGAAYTTARGVTLGITTDDADTTGYKMKVWGIDGVATEAAAAWETYTATKQVNLTAGDGAKTVYAKIKDDVNNESVNASASIILDTALPVVAVNGPDKSRISKVSGADTSIFTFSSGEAFVEYKVKVVAANTALHDAGTQIPETAGSVNMSGSGTFAADTDITCTVKGTDLESASAGDGVKIVKVFVKDAAGNWSAT